MKEIALVVMVAIFGLLIASGLARVRDQIVMPDYIKLIDENRADNARFASMPPRNDLVYDLR